jgi:hypothetical protein
MARRKLTLKDQLKGVRAALRSRRTPPQLKDGLRRRAKALENKLGMRNGRTKASDSWEG